MHVKERFTAYETADYLTSAADVAAYLEACLEEAGDDPQLVATALGNVAKARGMARLSKSTGITREGLYKALSADGNPSLGTVLRVLKAFGIRFAAVPIARRAAAKPNNAARTRRRTR